VYAYFGLEVVWGSKYLIINEFGGYGTYTYPIPKQQGDTDNFLPPGGAPVLTSCYFVMRRKIRALIVNCSDQPFASPKTMSGPLKVVPAPSVHRVRLHQRPRIYHRGIAPLVMLHWWLSSLWICQVSASSSNF